MDTEKIATLAIGILMIAVVITYLINLYKKVLKKEEDALNNIENKETQKPLKIVNLYNENGELLFTYRDVYLQHWDANIYNIYNSKNDKHIIRLDIGANMLLTSQSIENDISLLNHKD